WRDMGYRRRRAAAWTDRLEQLLEPYPIWPGFDRGCAVLAAAVLLLGVYHLIRPAVVESPADWVCLASAGATSMACLYASHRTWNRNIAGLGLALLTIAIVSATSMVMAPDPTWEYARQFPVRLNAAIFGLIVMILLYEWLPDVWAQQLMDGKPWTTTGRLIPHARRAAFMNAALGVMVGYNMAVWPLNPVAVAPDSGVSRWVFGMLSLSLLALVTGRFARRRNYVPLAALSVAALVGVFLFAFVRWPTSPGRGWLVQNASLVFAIVSLPVLGIAETLPKTRGESFAQPLWFLALLFLPAFALIQLAPRPPTEWLRPLTFTVLAATYAIAAAREHRRLLFVPSGALFLVAVATLIQNYRHLFARLMS
ncbi:MAG: hypothetical protein V3T70_04690, partial [Phycisphaerae bacterium]